MATVIGVRFKKAGKVYYFDVVVETARGVEYGEAVTSPRTVDDAQVVSPLKKVVRIATEEDARRAEQNAQHEIEAFKTCQERVKKHKLDMKLVSVEHTFDNSKIIFYFTADGRVDFRELVKDLASVFKMRIELRQIGVRDEAKMLGGLGSCGRPICCGAFLGDFQPVSIKMAKEQGLSLNPTKISGLCGRLMCCLKYEQDNYEAVLKRIPKVGKDLVTPDGVGVLTEIDQGVREGAHSHGGGHVRRARICDRRRAQARPRRRGGRARSAKAEAAAPEEGRGARAGDARRGREAEAQDLSASESAEESEHRSVPRKAARELGDGRYGGGKGAQGRGERRSRGVEGAQKAPPQREGPQGRRAAERKRAGDGERAGGVRVRVRNRAGEDC